MGWPFVKRMLKNKKWIRFCWKIGIAVVLGFFIHYPNPLLFIKNLYHLSDPESLIEPNAPFIADLNQEIDLRLPPEATPVQIFQVVQQYVYEKIPYEYDWNLWWNIDYWPTTTEVWEKRREDCDGQAILTVSLLRARGFKKAKLVGNLKHVWVQLEEKELMGPGTEKNFQSRDGKFQIALPSLRLLLDSFAFYLREFPFFRIFLLFLLIFLLCFEPCQEIRGFLGWFPFGLAGLFFLAHWAEKQILFLDFSGGFGLFGILFCWGGALFWPMFFAKKIEKK